MKRALPALVVVAVLFAALYVFARARHRKGQERVARRLGGLWNEAPQAPEPAATNAAGTVVDGPPATSEWPGYSPILPTESPGEIAERPGAGSEELSTSSPGADPVGSTVAPGASDVQDNFSVVTAAFERLALEGAELAMEEALLADFESSESAGSLTGAQPGETIADSDSPDDAEFVASSGLPTHTEAVGTHEPARSEPEPSPVSTPEPNAGTRAVPPREREVVFPEALEEALASMDLISNNSAASRSAEGYLDEGNVYFNVGQYSLAADRYGRALETDPTLVAAYYNRANALTRSGDYETALGDYDKALLLQPNDADALNNRGMLHLYRASYEDALRDFDSALTMEPGDTTVMVNRGLAYLHSGHAREALGDFESAAKIDGNDAAALYGAGQAAAQLGDRQAALRHLRRALDVDPGYAREAAADPKLSDLQGDHDFAKLLRDAGGR